MTSCFFQKRVKLDGRCISHWPYDPLSACLVKPVAFSRLLKFEPHDMTYFKTCFMAFMLVVALPKERTNQAKLLIGVIEIKDDMGRGRKREGAGVKHNLVSRVNEDQHYLRIPVTALKGLLRPPTVPVTIEAMAAACHSLTNVCIP